MSFIKTSVEDDLKNLDPIIRQTFAKCPLHMLEKLDYALCTNGKKLRPRIFLLTSKAKDEKSDGALEIAAAIELIHAASLIHDDIIDFSKFRRDKKALWTKFDASSAVLIGDLVWCKASMLLHEHAPKDVIQIIMEAAEAMIESEIQELEKIDEGSLSRSGYFDIISGKTASLFAAAAQAGAVFCGSRTNSQAFRDFGHNFGTAFQIMDDIVDYKNDHRRQTGSEKQPTKQLITLPLLIALERCSPKERTNLIQGLHDRDSTLHSMRQLIKSYESEGDAISVANSYFDLAKKAINKIDNNNLVDLLHEVTDNTTSQFLAAC